MNRDALLSAVKAVKPALASKTVIARADHFVLNTDRITAYDDRICLSYPIQLDVACTVPAEELLAALEGFDKDDEIELKINDENNLEITGGSTSAEIAIADPQGDGVEALIEALDLTKLKFKKTPKNLTEGLDWCRFSADKYSTEDNLHCVCIQKDKMYATDSYRLTRYQLDTPMTDMLIPAKNVSALIKHGFDEYAIKENWAHFRKKNDEGHMIFSTVILPMSFPEYDDILDEFSGEDYTYPAKSETIDLLRKITPLCKGDSEIEKLVTIQVSGKKGTKITISAWKENSKFKKTISLPKEKPPKEGFTFTVNPIFFADILSRIDTISISTGKLMFATEKFQHLVALFVEEDE